MRLAEQLEGFDEDESKWYAEAARVRAQLSQSLDDVNEVCSGVWCAWSGGRWGARSGREADGRTGGRAGGRARGWAGVRAAAAGR